MGEYELDQDQSFRIAIEVFIEFARFEYCLKASGFLKTQNGPAEPNWDKFANCTEIKELFDKIQSEPEASDCKMRYLLDKPPKQQIAGDDGLSWNKTNIITKSQDYFVAVRRVRNNLFHGGKFNGNFFEPQRSVELLEAVLCVLKAARDSHQDIKNAYEQSSYKDFDVKTLFKPHLPSDTEVRT